MTYTVTITSQGQISIPVALRRKYNLDKNRLALMRESHNGQIIFEPVDDFLSLRGSLKTTKIISSKKIREGFENYMAKRHLRKDNFPFPHVSP